MHFFTISITSIQFWRTALSMESLSFFQVSHYTFCCYGEMQKVLNPYHFYKYHAIYIVAMILRFLKNTKWELCFYSHETWVSIHMVWKLVMKKVLTNWSSCKFFSPALSAAAAGTCSTCQRLSLVLSAWRWRSSCPRPGTWSAPGWTSRGCHGSARRERRSASCGTAALSGYPGNAHSPKNKQQEHNLKEVGKYGSNIAHGSEDSRGQ